MFLCLSYDSSNYFLVFDVSSIYNRSTRYFLIICLLHRNVMTLQNTQQVRLFCAKFNFKFEDIESLSIEIIPPCRSQVSNLSSLCRFWLTSISEETLTVPPFSLFSPLKESFDCPFSASITISVPPICNCDFHCTPIIIVTITIHSDQAS